MTKVQNQDFCDNVRKIMISRGFSIKSLSDASNISVVSLSNIVNGKSLGQTETIIKLAKALDVDIAQLFVPAPSLKSVRFRSNATVSAREKATKKTVICNSAKWINDYNRLEKELSALAPNSCNLNSSSSISSFDASGLSPEDVAKKVRKEWCIGENNPITDISASLEKFGIKYWLTDFNSQQVFGLSIGEMDGGPAIVVNNNPAISAERQIFTTAHELGHLLMHKQSFSDSNEQIDKTESKKEEEEANLFAGELLLPYKAIKESLENTAASTLTSWVLNLKSQYKVSYKTVLKRAIDNNILGPEYYRLFAMQYNKFYHHDLKDYYEPNPNQDWVAKNEILSKTCGSEVDRTGFYFVVYKSFINHIIEKQDVANILQVNDEIAHQITDWWEKKTG